MASPETSAPVAEQPPAAQSPAVRHPAAQSPVAQSSAAQSPRETVTTEDPAPLEADIFDDDSVLGTDGEISTASLRSSLREYHMVHGRAYHKDENYWLPSDEQESDRLDIQNYQLLLTFDGRKYFAPDAETAKRVLDVGTGTGIWAIDFADEHPHAEVVGVDIAPIQPGLVPPNLRFEVDDVEKPWTWSQRFDYIFVRMLVGSLTAWEPFFKQAYDNLEPGGWIELQDPGFPAVSDDGTLKEGSPLWQYDKNIIQASKNFGRPMDLAADHDDRLRAQGFINVERKVFKWPTNTWPKDPKHKEVGLWTLANIEGNLEAISMALMTRGLGMTKEEVEVFLVGVRKDLRDRRIHAYWPLYVTIAQRPLES